MKRKYFRVRRAFLAVIALGLLLAVRPAQAAGASLYLSPGSRSVGIGSTLSVGVRINGGAGINAVQANLTYPADKLDFIGISYSGSAFSVQAQSGGGGGSVTIARGSLDLITGDRLVATVSFRAKVDSGSATIGVAASSDLASDGGSVPASKSGGTYTFTPAPVVTPAPPTPVPAPKDTTPPVISAISVKDRSAGSFTVTWQTDEAADSAVDYGLDSSYGLSQTTTAPAGISHSVTVKSSFILPELTYHFRVKSTDGSGNAAVSADQTVTTPGANIMLTVQDSDGHPVAGAKVTLDGQTSQTDSAGQAQLPSGIGTKTITISYGGRTTTKTFQVSSNDQAAPLKQTFTLASNTAPLGLGWQAAAGLVAVIGFATAIMAIVRLRLWRVFRSGVKQS